MSALDDLFDGHYFTEDPHVYIPIDEAQQELAELRADNARLQKAVEETSLLIEYIKNGENKKAHLQMLVVESCLEHGRKE